MFENIENSRYGVIKWRRVTTLVAGRVRTDLVERSSLVRRTCTRCSSHASTARTTWRCRESWSTCPAPICCPTTVPAATCTDYPSDCPCPAPTYTHGIHVNAVTPSALYNNTSQLTQRDPCDALRHAHSVVNKRGRSVWVSEYRP